VHWDRVLKEHELSGKPLTGILVGGLGASVEMTTRTTTVVLVVEELDGYAERIAVGTHQFARWEGNYSERNAKQYNRTRMNAKRREITFG
jgi:hypothetical protein